MGRPRKIKSMQSKHMTVEEQQEKEDMEEVIVVGKEQLSDPPNWLIDKIAKDEFKRIVSEFQKIDVVGNLDLNNIVCYCNAYAMYRRATKEIVGKPLIIEKAMANGMTQEVENPLINIQKKYAEEMRRFGCKCGLDIDSRLKVAAEQTTKMNIALEDDFGDF